VKRRERGRSSHPVHGQTGAALEPAHRGLGGRAEHAVGGQLRVAPVAWTAAWIRPEIFRGVASLSVPFGARGLLGLPGDPFGEVRPSVVQRELAGPDLLFYQEYFCLPGAVAEREAEADLRTWLTGLLYGGSANAPLPPELAGVDLTALPGEMVREVLRAAMCVPRGGGFGGLFHQPEKLPAWLGEDDLNFYLAELEHTGLTGPLNYYRNVDLDWELLAGHQGKPLTVASLFIGGDRDIVTIWGQEAIARATDVLTDLRGSVILRDCGHWIQQEQPEAANRELVQFLKGVA
jgi:pimeloyl-ACP methyl ester carboxylesterase